MSIPLKVTRDLRLVVEPDAPALTGNLGKTLIEEGALAVAREAVGCPQCGKRAERRPQ